MIRPARLHAVVLPLACAALVLASCASSKPAPNPAPAPSPTGQSAAQTPAAPPFNAAAVTEQTKNATIADIRTFVESLNQIIRRQDFDAWLTHLSDAYKAYYSDPATLSQISQYPIIKNRGIVLSSLKDFFLQVVYPAHQNDKVDDIDFISETLVKAITISPKGDRNILYILEKQGDAWKIGIGR
ncbi:MAG TPA: hypothetical protein VMC79_03675 [Rectinemataceae bacterium]|nr:hypothetical protein [Rectinemataceae bacterium]